MKRVLHISGIFLLMGMMSVLAVSSFAQDQETAPLQIKLPIELEEMAEYENIPFTEENFESVEKGMTEEEVLTLLGKPLDMEKIKRKGNRWQLHYFYPGERKVNERFRYRFLDNHYH